MALKLPDSAVPMGDFPVAKAVDIDFDDGENLQEKLDNGALGGGNNSNTTVIFDGSIDMGKYLLLAKITNANYSNNIIKFSCPNYKGVNDVGFRYEDDMDMLKFELHFNTGATREANGYGVTLKQHGLGLYSYPLNNPKNTSPEIKDAIRLYWDYSKAEIYVFLVDLMTAIPHCVLEYTGNGTLLKENTFVDDSLYNRLDGLNGTWQESKWKSIPYNKLETPPIHELGGDGGSGSAEGTTTYTSLSELGLTEPVSVGEIFNAMDDNTMAVLACEDITNHITDVPMSYGVLTIKKKNNSRFSIEYQNSLGGSAVDVKRWIGTVKGTDGSGLYWKEIQATNGEIITSDTIAKYGTEILKYPIGTWRIDSVNIGKQFTDLPYPEMAGVIEIDSIQPNKSPYEHAYGYRNYTIRDALSNIVYTRTMNSGNTAGTLQRDTGWQKIQVGNNKTTLVTNTTTLKLDVTKKNNSWYGAIKLTYLYDTSPVEVEITFRSATEDLRWAVINGQKYIKQITFTQDSSDTKHYTIGIEFSGTTYGNYQAEVIGDFADINSLTSEAFTGAKTAVYYSPWGKNNGVTLVSAPEDIGLTFPCTTVQLVQAMRDKFNKTITAGAIGVFNNGGKTVYITDAPSDYGLLHIEVFGHDRVMIRYDGISSSTYNGSHIGQIKGSNGTFNGIIWCRIDNETRISELETDVQELFQSVSSGKTLVANAITGKGVSTATDATFATMATNIGKISSGYKEETKSLIVTSDSTGTQTLTFTFSANVIAVKQIVAPSDSCRIVPQTSKNTFAITGKELTLYVTGSGTWKVTALIEK